WMPGSSPGMTKEKGSIGVTIPLTRPRFARAPSPARGEGKQRAAYSTVVRELAAAAVVAPSPLVGEGSSVGRPAFASVRGPLAASAAGNNPSPGFALRSHPLPQGERVGSVQAGKGEE